MSRGKDGPEDVDATFAEIVADLRAGGFGLPEEDTAEAAGTESRKTPERPADPPAVDSPPEPGWRSGGTSWDTTMFSDDPAGDDEHYVPPEPPPLPRPKLGAFLILLLFLSGLFLLILPGAIGVGPTVATPLGILALATAIALLLLRVRQGPPPGADPSNGAQV
ncbi:MULTISPECIES: hypothetical protein [unclassified Amycolatopsis]|uniref:hypothetical protein n=1 Tax=unclassified Amycolatopsis TaxID=2618356 RepID=UPI002874B2ED|nr:MULTISPECIES: hypothetical protein [unclassified Amycolatopsis]MDS0139635.1 hypothetical protein [Amycolatopsis sp. 505]MDS0145058.1 hypothetical protein [Amycolatopsis sp. CM201R]